MNDFIYYMVGDRTAKVPSANQHEFEKNFPNAQVMYTYKGRNVGVPLESRDVFISKVGADKLSYSAYDDENKYSSELSTRRIVTFESPTMSETADKTAAAAAIETESAGVEAPVPEKKEKMSFWESIAANPGQSAIAMHKPKEKEEEKELIWRLYFEGISEVELSKRTGVGRTTLQYRKYQILKKLKNMLEMGI